MYKKTPSFHKSPTLSSHFDSIEIVLIKSSQILKLKEWKTTQQQIQRYQ
jgi:hypothetical protein